MTGHVSRVGVLAWDKHILASGSKDGSIHTHDVRIAKHKTGQLESHTAEVCGLAYREDGAVLASGGNDNLVNIWEARGSVPLYSKTAHSAAVKALAWCPWQLNLLASGGGSTDKRLWHEADG
jgi:cell division cycle protein 20 (cofactor of APC complex)